MGRLGLLVGSGFSKAFAPNSLTWKELLEEVSKAFEINLEKISGPNDPMPKIATNLVKEIIQTKGINLLQARSELKQKVGRICSWLPSMDVQKKIGIVLSDINPDWIITTNYDAVIETMLADRGIQLNPDDTFSVPKDYIPIFHLHGYRLFPDSLVVTEEDYLAVIRPNEYRQTKMILQFKESTVLALGYGIGDQNVQIAIDWSKNVYKNISKHVANDFIQIVWVNQSPKSEPYIDHNGIVVQEIDDLGIYLEELQAKILTTKKQIDKLKKGMSEAAKLLSEPNETGINNFIDKQTIRTDIIEKVYKAGVTSITPQVHFLSKCIDKTWERSLPHGAFEAYDQQLNLLLDFLIAIPLFEIHPSLFNYIAESLDKLARYVGKKTGQSYAAANSWQKRRKDIPSDTYDELVNFSQNSKSIWLKEIL